MKPFVVLALIATVFLSGCVQPTCNKPYINMGYDCCLDANDNNICDSDDAKMPPNTTVNTDEFILTDANFDFISITPYADFNDRCERYGMFLNGTLPGGGADDNTKTGFYITYNIKDVPEEFQAFPGKPQFPQLKDFVECSLDIGGDVFKKLDVSMYGVKNLDRTDFCDNPVMSTTSQYCVPPVNNPSIDITKDTAVTLCCQNVCETKTFSGCK